MIILRVTDESPAYPNTGLCMIDINAAEIERIEHEDDWNCSIVLKSGFVVNTHRNAHYITMQLVSVDKGLVNCSYWEHDRDDI